MITKVSPPIHPPVPLKEVARHLAAIYKNIDIHFIILYELLQEYNAFYETVKANIHTTGMPDRLNMNADHDERYVRHGLVNVSRVTASASVADTDAVIYADTDGGAITLTLPAGSSGRALRVINCGTSGNNVTISPDGLEYLFGANDPLVLVDGQKCDICYDETEGWDGFVGYVPVVWDDLRITPGSFDRPGVSDPAYVPYSPGGGGAFTYLPEFAKNDFASFTIQLPHAYMEGEDITVHVHWTPGDRGNEENGATVGWKVDWSWANINGTFGVMQTADLSDACDGSDHKHQMTPEATLSGSGKNISSMLQCNIKRTDTGADDTWAGTASGQLPLLLEVDFHIPINTMGSRAVASK